MHLFVSKRKTKAQLFLSQINSSLGDHKKKSKNKYKGKILRASTQKDEVFKKGKIIRLASDFSMAIYKAIQ